MHDHTPNIPRITAWIEDLESGKFEQCQGALARGTAGSMCTNMTDAASYCCLGVAAVTAINSGFMGEVDWYGGTLSRELTEFFGLPSSNPILYVEECSYDGCEEGAHTINVCATDANDDKNMSFVEIAGKLRERFDIPKPEAPTE